MFGSILADLLRRLKWHRIGTVGSFRRGGLQLLLARILRQVIEYEEVVKWWLGPESNRGV